MSKPPTPAECVDGAYDAGDRKHEAKLAGLTKTEAKELVHGLMAAGLDPDDPTWRTQLVQAPHPNEVG